MCELKGRQFAGGVCELFFWCGAAPAFCLKKRAICRFGYQSASKIGQGAFLNPAFFQPEEPPSVNHPPLVNSPLRRNVRGVTDSPLLNYWPLSRSELSWVRVAQMRLGSCLFYCKIVAIPIFIHAKRLDQFSLSRFLHRFHKFFIWVNTLVLHPSFPQSEICDTSISDDVSQHRPKSMTSILHD